MPRERNAKQQAIDAVSRDADRRER